MVHMWRSEGNFWYSALSFHSTGSRIVLRTPDLAASMFYPLSHLCGLNIFKAWAGTCLNSRAVAFRNKAKASWRGQNQHRDFRFLSEDLETGNLQFMLNIALIWFRMLSPFTKLSLLMCCFWSSCLHSTALHRQAYTLLSHWFVKCWALSPRHWTY